jgi:serine/threonine protein kinase
MNSLPERAATHGAEPPDDPFGLVGVTLAGKYGVERVVAETELSVIYRARHRVWQRPVAIKVFKSPMLAEAARDRLLESFVREGALMMDLSERCAAICQARDVGSTVTASGDWVPYTVLEWLEGETLEAAIGRGARPRPVKEVLELLDPIATALAVAHERGVVHLDVKPGNVFLLTDAGREDARCKLLDFGIAKVVDLAGARTSLDGFGQRSFTPAYGAPEQFSPAYGSTGPWTDVFALALVFVELITGREPLAGDTIAQLAAESCDATRRPTPGALGVAVHGDVERVIARALSVKPADRYPNAGDFWFALCHAARKREARATAVPAENAPAADDGAAHRRSDDADRPQPAAQLLSFVHASRQGRAPSRSSLAGVGRRAPRRRDGARGPRAAVDRSADVARARGDGRARPRRRRGAALSVTRPSARLRSASFSA